MSRTVPLQTSAPRAGLVTMASYTIQEDAPPWMSEERDRDRDRSSTMYADERHRASAMYTDDSSHADSAVHVVHDGDPLPPRSPDLPSFHAHPRQEVVDNGPHNPNNRKAIFKQVRSMLSKPGGQAKWDELSGEPSETGRPSQNVRPSAYVSPWQGAFQARRRSPERKTPKTQHDLTATPHDRHVTPSPPAERDALRPASPDSPVSSTAHSLAPSQVSVNAVSKLPPGVNVKSQVKRKAVTNAPASPSATENIPPPQDWQDIRIEEASEELLPNTCFSWSTAASPKLRHLDNDSTPKHRDRDNTSTNTLAPPSDPSNSRFSWSTIATNNTSATTSTHDPPSVDAPTVPSIPAHHLEPPPSPAAMHMPSILSRKRPVQRLDAEPKLPQATTPRTPSALHAAANADASHRQPASLSPALASLSPTPSLAPSSTPSPSRAPSKSPSKSSLRSPKTPLSPVFFPPAKIITTPDPTSGLKALPLPPFMTSTQATHLSYLLVQEKNLVLQRRNIEKSIADLENIEKASPLEVSFGQVREAKGKLQARRGLLAEVRREEMEVGIRIARCRRKEDFGEGEGTLWVRRVTG